MACWRLKLDTGKFLNSMMIPNLTMKLFQDNPDGLMSFLMKFAFGEPCDEDCEEPVFKVIEEEEGRRSLQCWEQAKTFVYENQEGLFTCEESLEFQSTWAIRKFVPGWATTLKSRGHFPVVWCDRPKKVICSSYSYLANGQPFKLLGITYLVGKIKFKLLFQGPLAK